MGKYLFFFSQRHSCKMHNAMKTQANLESSLKGINWNVIYARKFNSFVIFLLP